jgi:UDP-N-acetylmuramyl pentapeptide synthase
MLTLADVKKVCPLQKGVQLDDVGFQVVYSNSELSVSKGLFLPLSLDNEENNSQLKTALNNGAIAVLWRKDHALPSFLPNHFPVFIVDDLLDSLNLIVKNYINSNTVKGTNTVHTNFLFSITIKHNDENISYANAVKDKLINLTTILKKAFPDQVLDEKGGEGPC